MADGIHGKLYLHAWYPTYSMFMAMSRLKRKGNGSSLRPTSADHGRDWAEDDKSVGKKVEPLDPADGIGEPVSNMQVGPRPRRQRRRWEIVSKLQRGCKAAARCTVMKRGEMSSALHSLRAAELILLYCAAAL